MNFTHAKYGFWIPSWSHQASVRQGATLGASPTLIVVMCGRSDLWHRTYRPGSYSMNLLRSSMTERRLL